MSDKRYYMACLDLEGRNCLVVGGGSVGLEKAKGLLDTGAIVTVVAPQIEPELQRLPVRWRRARYQPSDLEGQFLVVAATSVNSVNRRVFLDAESRSMLCNVVDTPEICSFILPAVYRRDPIAIAVSTGGASPALAKRLRDDLGARIDEEHVDLAHRLRDLRPWVRNHYHSYRERKEFFETVVEDALGSMTVFLVGAGPGDPGLITVRGLELIRACDVLIHDRLVADQLVAEAPADAIRIGRERLEQEEINRLLVLYRRRGLDVVRLKGGDPFVFGRGGEEALALAEAGVPFEVVPGVSSLSAVPASAGIPITHRGVSAKVTIVQGHGPIDFGSLAGAGGTIVLFMALARLAEIAAGLVAHGLPPATPAAVISNGTTRAQEVVTAPLDEIAEAAADLVSPALFVIGDVVGLAATLTSAREMIALAS